VRDLVLVADQLRDAIAEHRPRQQDLDKVKGMVGEFKVDGTTAIVGYRVNMKVTFILKG
jgi:hypothetical protein